MMGWPVEMMPVRCFINTIDDVGNAVCGLRRFDHENNDMVLNHAGNHERI